MPPQHERGARPRRPGLPARRRWGQNFLANPATAEKIVAAARVGPNDTILEIGPGEGALTRPLARMGARVVAVEIDPLRARALETEFAGTESVRVLQGDVLARPFAEWLAEGGAPGAAVLVANLPYNVATPILTAALDAPETIRRSVATVQREVARRFVARPGDEGYGFISVRAASRATGRVLFDLPPGAFRPRPKVTSSVLELVPLADPPDRELARRALCLASLGFNARRKTLPNALASAAPRPAWEEALARIGKDPRARAEELSLDDFLALARQWQPAG
jgi:16S rRNA (adenine1518-N6/adenine1519-N6)-dimethyltransferase